MKKIEKWFICLTIIAIVIGGACTKLLKPLNKLFDEVKIEILYGIGLLLLVFFVIVILCLGFAYCIREAHKGSINVKKCLDPFWDGIDACKKGARKTNDSYLEQIGMINLYYRKDGKVDQLIKDDALDCLYMRLDFLNNSINFYNDVITLANSLFISLLASLVFTVMGNENISAATAIFEFLGIWILFFVLVFGRYRNAGQGGSYRYLVYEYERKCLVEKIGKFCDNLKKDELFEIYGKTKSVVIDALEKKKCRLFWKKHELDETIAEIEKLDLSIAVNEPFEKREVCINEDKIYLIYAKKMDDEVVNEEDAFISEDYRKLHNILKDNDLFFEEK